LELAAGVASPSLRSCGAVTGPGWLYDAMSANGIDVSLAPTRAGSFDAAYLWRLLSVARRQRAALIQSHLLGANLYSSAVARLLGIPAVATFHGMVDIAVDDRWARAKLRLIQANVSHLVFVSHALRAHFQKHFGSADGNRADRSVVIANGIDPDQFRPEPNRDLRAELGVSSDVLLVGAVGNVRRAKGYDDLLRVAAALRDECPNVRFVVAGQRTEPLYGRLLEQRRALGIDDRVTFVGFRDDTASFLNGVDLYLSTSTSEGFSLTTIQAMACGVPAIATRSGGPEEIITDGLDGVLVPVSDPKEAAGAIARLASDVAARRQLGGAGRRTVLQRFTKKAMIGAYAAIYEECLERPRGRPSSRAPSLASSEHRR
jgi:glycosyltransferase involved in cell wall biosynthesis